MFTKPAQNVLTHPQSPFLSLLDNSAASHLQTSPNYNSPQPQFHISFLPMKYTDLKL